MRKRKSVEVEKMKAYANEQLARTDEFADNKFKAGICVFLWHFLSVTGNYKGYAYLYWNKEGWNKWRADGSPDMNGTDWKEMAEKYVYGNLGEYARVYY